MTRLIALALLSCSVELHSPAITDPLCTRVIIDVHTAPADQCIRLSDQNGLTLFRRAEAESCGGPNCLLLQPGESAYALGKFTTTYEPHWRVDYGACDLLPPCE